MNENIKCDDPVIADAIDNYFDLVNRAFTKALDIKNYYGSMVIGRYQVLMVDLKEFSNGGCVYIYKLKEISTPLGKTNIITAKKFFDGIHRYTLQIKQTYIVVGFLESEVYKDKNGQWINNGGIINMLMEIPVREEKK